MTVVDSQGTVRYEERGPVAHITFDRPAKLNAFNTVLYGELTAAIRRAVDGPADVIVLSGAGRAFSTGGDLAEVRELVDSGAGLKAFFDKLPFAELYECPKTTVASVRGPCLAGGIEIALLCDLVIAAQGATFGFSQARIGLADTTAPHLLHSRVPLPQAQYLLYTGRTVSAAEAAAMGMVTVVVPDDELERRTDEIVAEVRAVPASVRREYKTLIRGLTPFPPHRSIPVPETLDLLREFFNR
ncbi:MAG TPA: enoyl-CoA hydratase/isomerase family protein [Micromonosporaceae bacterium]|jgi:methylglutaconyl-CoA hydratase